MSGSELTDASLLDQVAEVEVGTATVARSSTLTRPPAAVRQRGSAMDRYYRGSASSTATSNSVTSMPSGRSGSMVKLSPSQTA